jgi:hypothetical protein
MDLSNYNVGDVISYIKVESNIYHQNGGRIILDIWERVTVCSTPIRPKDICIERVYIENKVIEGENPYLKKQNSSEIPPQPSRSIAEAFTKYFKK